MKNIRSWDASFGMNGLGILLGALLVLSGITELFFNPFNFLTKMTEVMGGLGVGEAPIIVVTLLGWTLLIYSLLNRKNWKVVSDGDNWINKLKLGKRINLKNSLFIWSTAVFILVVTSTFLLVRPDTSISEKENSFQQNVEDIEKKFDELIKSAYESRKKQ